METKDYALIGLGVVSVASIAGNVFQYYVKNELVKSIGEYAEALDKSNEEVIKAGETIKEQRNYIDELQQSLTEFGEVNMHFAKLLKKEGYELDIDLPDDDIEEVVIEDVAEENDIEEVVEEEESSEIPPLEIEPNFANEEEEELIEELGSDYISRENGLVYYDKHGRPIPADLIARFQANGEARVKMHSKVYPRSQEEVDAMREELDEQDNIRRAELEQMAEDGDFDLNPNAHDIVEFNGQEYEIESSALEEAFIRHTIDQVYEDDNNDSDSVEPNFVSAFYGNEEIDEQELDICLVDAFHTPIQIRESADRYLREEIRDDRTDVFTEDSGQSEGITFGDIIVHMADDIVNRSDNAVPRVVVLNSLLKRVRHDDNLAVNAPMLSNMFRTKTYQLMTVSGMDDMASLDAVCNDYVAKYELYIDAITD